MSLFKNSLLLAVAALCFVGGVWWHSNFKTQFVPSRLIATISQNIDNLLAKMDEQAEQLVPAFAKDSSAFELPDAFYLLENGEVAAWGTNKFVPDTSLLNGLFNVRFAKNHRGDFLIKKWKIDSRKVLVGIIPLVEQYKVVNKYLYPVWNKMIFPNDGLVLSDLRSTTGSSVCGERNACYFKVEFSEFGITYPTNYISIILLSLGIFCVTVFVVLFCIRLYQNGYADVAFLCGLVLIFGGRILTVSLGFPRQWGDLTLFNPQQFAYSSYNVTLGDFVINSVLGLISSAVLFSTYSKFTFFKKLNQSSRTLKTIVSVLLLTVAFFSFLYPYLFFEIIAHNSSIQLDITQQVSFDAYRFWAFGAIVCSVISSFLFCHVLLRVAVDLTDKRNVSFIIHLAFALLIFYGYCQLEDHDYFITGTVGLVYFLSVHVLRFYRAFYRVSFLTFLYLLLAITAYSLQNGLTVRKFKIESTEVAHARFGNNSLVGQDILGEYLLNETLRKIENDPFVISRFSSPLLPKSVIRQRVQQVYMSSYFDRYKFDVKLFSRSGEEIENNEGNSTPYLFFQMQADALKTSYEGIFKLKGGKGASARRYVGIARIEKHNELLGFVMLDMSLKNVLPQNVYPELLVDNRFSKFLAARDFSYAYIDSSRLVNSFGAFNYRKYYNPNWLTNESIRRSSLLANDFIHNAIDGDQGEVALVSSPAYPLLGVVANGAFYFLVILLLVLVCLVVFSIASYLQGTEPNYATKIQLYVFVAFILPLLVVSVVTLNLLNKSSELKIEKELQDRVQQLSLGITPFVERSIDSVENKRQLNLRLLELSKSFDVDVNVYTASGLLAASSRAEIFNNQLLSNFINPTVFQLLVHENETYLTNKEEIGKLQFSNSYLAMRRPETGELEAILNVPFFNSIDQNDRNAATVLSNILIVFVGVFILFSLLSYYAVQWLTFPLRFITKTLRATTLGANQQLVWKANDEIGLMVSEYNQMVRNLELSRVQLARTQKETAWREMAQQVAHEIKNPLTPMKLSLQRMQSSKRLDGDQTKTVLMLLEQVEILNQIASSFSTFAKMPTPLLERKDLTEIVEAVVQLYANFASGKVYLDIESRPIFVMMDVPLMNRILSNLILNGLQSGADGQSVKVRVKIVVDSGKCIVSVEDDGVGMDTTISDKIFVPYFSTKKEGSGLGLAIAKQGIEQFGGSISFSSQAGEGTIFQIVLPVN